MYKSVIHSVVGRGLGWPSCRVQDLQSREGVGEEGDGAEGAGLGERTDRGDERVNFRHEVSQRLSVYSFDIE